MEQELGFLRQEIRTHVSTIHRLQTALYDQQARSNAAAVSLRTQLRKKDQQLRKTNGEHERRMSAILSHLLYLEGQLLKEQRQMTEVLHEKDDVIRRQRAAIEDLASKNTKLLDALKEAHGYSGNNGILNPAAREEGGSPQVVLRNKDKASPSYKVRFSSMKDKLRRHKSSLELYRSDGLEVPTDSPLRFGSQENLSSLAGGLSSDEMKKARLLERKVKCRSMVDYPFRLNDLPEVSSEAEKGKSDPGISDDDDDQDLSHDSSAGSAHRLHLKDDNSRHSFNDLEDSNRQTGEEPSGSQASYGEVPRSPSMPQSLSVVLEQTTPPGGKERPHSLTGVEVLSMEKVSMCPSPTSPTPPGASDSNPFKSFKNVFRRRNSKQRSKKRPVSLGQETNKEYHEALKEHFKKYDLQ